jgi:pimeloyl-ACP methyl ester carboxylesterase
VLAAFRKGPPRYIDVGHSRLAYWSFGEGPDLVFVHGWPLHSATFRRLVPALARDFRCHFFDLPGAGRTESDPSAPFGLVEHSETLRRAIDLIGLGRYAFVAHDSGGAMARLVAASDDRVTGLVLGNTEIPGHRVLLVEFFMKLTRIPGAMSLLRAAMRSRTVRHSSLGFGGCFEDPRSMDGDFHDLFIAPILDSPSVLADQSRLLASLDFGVVDRLTETHGRIKAPTLLIWGSDDPFFPLEKARGMLTQFAGGAEIQVIPRAKLFAHEDHAPEFLAFAQPFLQRTRPD